MTERTVREVVQELAGTRGKNFDDFLSCEVLSVDPDNRQCTCKPISGKTDAEITAKLMTDPNDGILIMPAIGSTILVGLCLSDGYFVFMFSDIDGFSIITSDGKTQFVIDLNGAIQFNDGSFGGLIKIADLVTKINNIENLLNDIILLHNTHVHTGGVLSGALTGMPTVSETDKINPITKISDIENSLITHGQ